MEGTDRPREINYHLELTPAQLKVTHTALHALLDDFGHDEADVGQIVHEVLAKLPDEHAVRAIDLPHETTLRQVPDQAPEDLEGPDEPGDPPSAA